MNVKLILSYDGTAYLGWQKTRMGPSIESILQKALETILQEEVILQAASRTDAGVHACKQVVNFFTNQDLEINGDNCLVNFAYRLNQILSKDIVILQALKMPDDFHPTLDCHSKIYHYSICLGKVQIPEHRFYSWHFPYPLDISLMKEAAVLFLGNRDFSSLCNVKKNASYKDKMCHLYRITIVPLPEDRLRIEIEGSRFLYKMARNIVGTLIYVACGKINIEEIPSILTSGSRPNAGITAPANGLMLFDVFFPGKINEQKNHTHSTM